MRPIQDHNLAQLLQTLRFTPESKRQKQLDAAEELIALIDPQREYPFEFVFFKITGFSPKETVQPYVLPGELLLHDLRLFVTQLSSRDAQQANEAGERIFTIEALAQHLNVSTKTINRWRKRGLVTRKYIFDDGVKRLGLSDSAVQRFLQTHPELIQQAGQFQRLSEEEKQQVLDLARTLSADTSRSRHQVIAEIAQQTGRAHETIRTLLQQFERDKGSMFLRPAGALSPEQSAELYTLYQQGVPVPQLTQQFHRSRSSIYRIINQRRASALMARKIQYVHSPEFESRDRVQAILHEAIEVPAHDHPLPESLFSPGGETVLPNYLQTLNETPVLNHEQENDLFRKYNCLKFLAIQERPYIDRAHLSSARLSRIESYLSEAEEIERLIVEANLRLVVSIASKHSGAGPHFAELVSKGNYALIKAIQEFDYTTGFHFGKRAALNIAKEYAKVSGKSTELTRTRAQSLANIQRQLRQTTDVGTLERTRHNLIEVIKRELSTREQYVILHHFGLIGSGLRKETQTLKEIGDNLGLTKERIRQIELIALQKLRQCLSSEQFELLTA